MRGSRQLVESLRMDGRGKCRPTSEPGSTTSSSALTRASGKYGFGRAGPKRSLQTLAAAGVDLINTDDLPGSQKFLREKRPRGKDANNRYRSTFRSRSASYFLPLLGITRELDLCGPVCANLHVHAEVRSAAPRFSIRIGFPVCARRVTVTLTVADGPRAGEARLRFRAGRFAPRSMEHG